MDLGHTTGRSPDAGQLGQFGPALLRARRALLRRRRLITALLATAAALSTVALLAPPTSPTRTVIVAATDLDSGVELSSDDIRRVEIDPDLVPAGAATDSGALVGHIVAGPMREGEPFTDRRLVSAALLDGYAASLVATPLRLADATVAGLLHVGDRIDIYAATGTGAGSARIVLVDAPVLALPASDDADREGAVVVLAVTPSQTAALAQASATTALTVSIRG